MNKVKRVYVNARKPVHHIVEFLYYVVIIERTVTDNGHKLGRNLKGLSRSFIERKLVLAAVYSVEKTFRDVGARAEELHVFTDAHARNAACDAIIVAHFGAHQVVAFILYRRRFKRNFGAELLEVFGQAFAP